MLPARHPNRLWNAPAHQPQCELCVMRAARWLASRLGFGLCVPLVAGRAQIAVVETCGISKLATVTPLRFAPRRSGVRRQGDCRRPLCCIREHDAAVYIDRRTSSHCASECCGHCCVGVRGWNGPSGTQLRIVCVCSNEDRRHRPAKTTSSSSCLCGLTLRVRCEPKVMEAPVDVGSAAA